MSDTASAAIEKRPEATEDLAKGDESLSLTTVSEEPEVGTGSLEDALKSYKSATFGDGGYDLTSLTDKDWATYIEGIKPADIPMAFFRRGLRKEARWAVMVGGGPGRSHSRKGDD